MKKQNILLVGFAVLLVGGFQNCAKMNFTTEEAALKPSSADASGDPSSQDPSASASPTPRSSGNPPVVDISDDKDFSCKQFVEINYDPSSILNVPKRDGNGLCYIVKIISAVVFQKSVDNPNVDNEVISRNHADNKTNHHPFVLGSQMVRMRLEGARAIKLSGGKNDSSNILVDNFLLIGVAPSAVIGDPQYYKAYGTSDSEAIGYAGVLFKDVVIPVKAFATGGTSTIKPLSLEGSIEVDRDYSLDVRGLDAGSYGEISDIYLLFQ